MIAFSGVRISWLMVATKALFACDPARAASCDAAQLLFGELALGDVAHVGGEQRLAAFLHHRDGDLHRERLTAAAHAGQLDAPPDRLPLAGPEVTLEADHQLGTSTRPSASCRA